MSPTALPIPTWQPLTAEQLGALLEKVRNWEPLDVAAIFDDLDRVLGEQHPEADALNMISDRLRGALIQLGNIAVADPCYRPDAETLAWVEHARTLRGEGLSGGCRQAPGRAPRTVGTASDLVERPIDERRIKGTTDANSEALAAPQASALVVRG